MPATPSRKLPRRSILRKRGDFDLIRREGSRVVQSEVVCNYLIEPGKALHAGFVVGKACGPAHTRNLIKRRMREIYRQNIAPQATPGLQTVWIARQNAARVPFATLKEQMLHMATRAGWITPVL